MDGSDSLCLPAHLHRTGDLAMIYLASPYSHPDPAVREARFHAACRQVADMLRCGIAVFSPVVYFHQLATDYALPPWECFWWALNPQLLGASDEVWVLKLDGWEKSRGVRAGMKMAKELGKPVMLIEPDPHDAQAAKMPLVMLGPGGGYVRKYYEEDLKWLSSC